jgi:hypothetical protein
VAWGVGVGAAGLTAALSVVAAHAFKGHTGKVKVAAAISRRHRGAAGVSVPAPQDVPAISGAPAPLEPPGEPPAAAQEQQGPAPAVSGGS